MSEFVSCSYETGQAPPQTFILTKADRARLAARLASMSGDEVRRFFLNAEVGSEEENVAAGECERRNIDV